MEQTRQDMTPASNSRQDSGAANPPAAPASPNPPAAPASPNSPRTPSSPKPPAAPASSWSQASGWLRKNLFNNWYNSALTLALAAIAGILAYYGLRFLLFTSNWAPVRTNLTLLMIGTFPRNQQWRIVVQVFLLSSFIGVFWGAFISAARDRAAQAGLDFSVEPIWSVLRRWWALFVFLGVLLLLTQTIVPLIITISAVGLMICLREIVMRFDKTRRSFAWIFGSVCLIVSWQILSGTRGAAWWWAAGLLSFLALRAISRLQERFSYHPILSQGRARFLISLVAIAVATALAWAVYLPLDFQGVGWDKWSGFHLNLTAAVISIVAAFPLGMLLALGRRSKLPVVRWLSITYIELIRGVPLIGLLFLGNVILGFFIDISAKTENSWFLFSWFDSIFEFFRDTSTPLSQVTRAIAVLTIFTSAYLAEVIRGGFQAVTRGQIEAGQAVGLSPFQTTRLIVMPQAITAVIPSLVGQFINLLKDSTLLSVIAVLEILRVRQNIHSQADFITLGIAETLLFIGFAFWTFAYTMSRESQRLEKKLGVGTR